MSEQERIQNSLRSELRRLDVDPHERDVAKQSVLNVASDDHDGFALLHYREKYYRIRISALKTVIENVSNAAEFWERVKPEWQLTHGQVAD